MAIGEDATPEERRQHSGAFSARTKAERAGPRRSESESQAEGDEEGESPTNEIVWPPPQQAEISDGEGESAVDGTAVPAWRPRGNGYRLRR